MKILFVGNVDFSAFLLKRLLKIGAPIVGVITKESSSFNADHQDLSVLAKEYGIPYLCVKDINSSEVLDWIRKLGADTCYCFGFSQLLSKEILSLFPNGSVGYHPAALPFNRGRHPIIWALVLGLKETASTFFLLTESADSGDIISQESIVITYEDDAQSLYNKLIDKAVIQIEQIYHASVAQKIKRQPQTLSKGNIWRKRSKDDGRIDFRMEARAIYNLVRALTKPYIGAHIFCQGQEIKVWKVREEKVAEENIEPGKVLKVDGRQILVKCYPGAIWLVEHDFIILPKTGEYFL